MFSHGYRNGGNPWAVGVYATGNKDVAIRDYAINHNPLNYSDLGFDTPGNEVHADGEIWNGTNWSVRQALVDKWNAKFPYRDAKLQLRCSQATATRTPLPPSQCPGNRRWIQLVFDAFLLQQGATSMLDARDAMLAADRMRFGGRDLTVMWDAFARRGMGKGASTPDADSGSPVPSFASPRARNAVVRFAGSKGGRIYVGHFEARATPVADTSRKTKKVGDTVTLTPGRYEMLAVEGARLQALHAHRAPWRAPDGPAADAEEPRRQGERRAGARRHGRVAQPRLAHRRHRADRLGGVTGDNVKISHPSVSVDLAGGVHVVHRVQVSAMLNPAPPDPTEVPLAKDPDPDSGSRFTALRQFASRPASRAAPATTRCGSA